MFLCRVTSPVPWSDFSIPCHQPLNIHLTCGLRLNMDLGPTMDALVHLLNYAATHPEAKIRYHASDMVLHIVSDASYLSASEARSRLGGYFFLSKNMGPDIPSADDAAPPFNAPIFVNSSIIRAKRYCRLQPKPNLEPCFLMPKMDAHYGPLLLTSVTHSKPHRFKPITPVQWALLTTRFAKNEAKPLTCGSTGSVTE
jgi:hypothetical protein